MEYEDYMAQLSNAGVIPTAPRVAGSGGASNLEQRAYQTYMNEMQRLMQQDQPRPVGSGSTSDAEFEAYRQAVQEQQAISNMLVPKMRPVGSGSTSDAEFEAYRGALPAPALATNLTDFFINLGTKLGGR